MTESATVGTEVPKLTPTFSHVESIVLARLREAGGQDVPIASLFCAAFDVAFRDLPPPRDCQQRLGAYISRLNRKLEGERVAPGLGRRTYRLERV